MYLNFEACRDMDSMEKQIHMVFYKSVYTLRTHIGTCIQSYMYLHNYIIFKFTTHKIAAICTYLVLVTVFCTTMLYSVHELLAYFEIRITFTRTITANAYQQTIPY